MKLAEFVIKFATGLFCGAIATAGIFTTTQIIGKDPPPAWALCMFYIWLGLYISDKFQEWKG